MERSAEECECAVRLANEAERAAAGRGLGGAAVNQQEVS
jgi:hypothetical protein